MSLPRPRPGCQAKKQSSGRRARAQSPGLAERVGPKRIRSSITFPDQGTKKVAHCISNMSGFSSLPANHHDCLT